MPFFLFDGTVFRSGSLISSMDAAIKLFESIQCVHCMITNRKNRSEIQERNLSG